MDDLPHFCIRAKDICSGVYRDLFMHRSPLLSLALVCSIGFGSTGTLVFSEVGLAQVIRKVGYKQSLGSYIPHPHFRDGIVYRTESPIFYS